MALGALSIEVVSPSGHLWSGDAAQLSVPLVDGEMGVLPGRQPILAVIGSGLVRITTHRDSGDDGRDSSPGDASGDGSLVLIRVTGGFCSVDHDTVTIAADEATMEGTAEDRASRAGGGSPEENRV
ncbi:F0F1 ATP synthase subunit epsilon [Actinomyces lilanjuaniae]|uniref:ATP synthase epsilon chain n=1 Tax=Actinomyces lilanjuaniae TaxID=2321394 RepID=A0ABN5PPB1_9ACTO|nr:F0F1 ATP synthase subunit epsilon [Actinomyces lilanjuaniae]AYD90181.1 F0F1 ATP synthase subunit epsilon [Actinomyces lilanjuaniae]